MERSILHQSELTFCLTQTDNATLNLKIIWSVDTTHVLVVVNNQNGQIWRVFLLTREMEKLTWMGFSKINTSSIQVYGLKLDTATGRERRERRDITLYSVEGVKKFIIPLAETGTKVVDLRLRNGQDHMMDSLVAQTSFDMEPQHEPPMDHSLKLTLPSDSTVGLYIVYNEKMKKEYLIMSSVSSHSSNYDHKSVPLLPIQHSRTMYRVCAIALKDMKTDTMGSRYVACGKSSVLTIKTCNSKEDLQMLMDKAQKYCDSHSRSPETYPIRQLYRNKPRRYFDDILNSKDGLMAKYIKDNNGDPYCPINNQINGLFFTASLVRKKKRRKPPSFSFFGDTRLFIPAEELITPGTRMYFSDFYCHRQIHYVTLVLTKMGSFEDRFCEGRLPELDLEYNPFFTIQENASFGDSEFIHPDLSQSVNQKIFSMASVNMFHVEFFYTEDVNIAALVKKCGFGQLKHHVRLIETTIRGRGQSMDNGIPKNAKCKICNLD